MENSCTWCIPHGTRELRAGWPSFLGVARMVRRAGVLPSQQMKVMGLQHAQRRRLGASKVKARALLPSLSLVNMPLDHLERSATLTLLGAVGELDGVRGGQLSNFSNPLDDISERSPERLQ